MKAIIVVDGTEKEIAALVAELQEQQKLRLISCGADSNKAVSHSGESACGKFSEAH